jgi:hypothetical protein
MSEGYSREEEPGTSWVSVVFGWLAALGAGVILSGIVGVRGCDLRNFGVRRWRGGRGLGPRGTFDHLLASLSRGGLRGGADGEPLRGIARPPGSAPGVGSHDSPGAPGSGHRNQPRKRPDQPPERRSGPGRDPLHLRNTRPALPFLGGAVGGAWGASTGRRRP